MVRLFRRGAIAGAALIGAQAAYAILRPAPDLESFDPSGVFGEPDLPSLHIAVLGDSSVTSPGVAGPEEICVSIVCERLAANFNVILDSFAVGGSMTHDLIREQMEPALRVDPDLIYVTVGGNEVLKGVSRRRFATNLDHLISRLSESKALILQSGVGDMGTIPRLHPPLSTYFTHRSNAFDRVHREVAARHGTYVVATQFNKSDLWRDRSMWADDLFHVSAAGHRQWADTLWETLDPLIPVLNASG